MKILIVSNGDAPTSDRLKAAAATVDLIIAADGGAACLFANNIVPHILVGDFDSLSKELVEFYGNAGVDCTRYPEAKDFSDHELAVYVAIKKGATEIVFAGILGGRIEYTLTNILFCAQPMFAEIDISIINGQSGTVQILRPNISYQIRGKAGNTFSLVPLSPEVRELNMLGSAWPLSGATLEMGKSLTISNKFLDDVIEINFQSGSLMISYEPV